MDRVEALDLSLEIAAISLEDIAANVSVCPNSLYITLLNPRYSLVRDLGISNRKATVISKSIAPNKNSKESAVHRLFLEFDLKHCLDCDEVKFLEEYYADSSYCKYCTDKRSSNWYSNNTHDKAAYNKKYLSENRKTLNAYSAKKKADKIRATPRWADLSKIKEIYAACPDGYHVDHIIPLRGKLVCGLHVENNLQHLLAVENIRKGNKHMEFSS